MWFVLSPVHFAIVLKHFFWLLLVWFCQILSRKPIRQGDVVALEKSFAGARWGWITDIGLLYVKVATRNGVLLLRPNEAIVTQNVENLSFDDNLVRLHIPFGISYASDLKKAVTLAEGAAMSVDRVLKIPQPKHICVNMEPCRRKVDNMEILPYKDLFNLLWDGAYM